MIKRILLALGGTPFSDVALTRGIELAREHGAELTAVTVLDMERWKGTFGTIVTAGQVYDLAEQKPWLHLNRHLERMIADFKKQCEQYGIRHEIHKPLTDPLGTLISEWRYHDLVIFGLRGLFDYTIVPAPVEAIVRLIEAGVRPVLAVAARYRPIRKVLIAYSGSMESAKTMKQFFQMHLWAKPQIELVCFTDDDEKAHLLLADAARYCLAHGMEATTRRIDGAARQHLLPHAERVDADLIVLGDSFRSVLVRQILGDTMSHLVQNSARPLFLSH